MDQAWLGFPRRQIKIDNMVWLKLWVKYLYMSIQVVQWTPGDFTHLDFDVNVHGACLNCTMSSLVSLIWLSKQ